MLPNKLITKQRITNIVSGLISNETYSDYSPDFESMIDID